MSDHHLLDTDEFPAQDAFLAKHFGPSPPPVGVKFAALSDRGSVRENNEDHFVVIERRRMRNILLTNLPEGFLRPADDVAYVMGVADGMGGVAFGELASMMALKSGWEQAPSAIKWSWIINDREVEDLKERVELIFRRMDQSLAEAGRSAPERAGMGTTLTAAYTVGPEAFIAHVGDSRAYLFHGGKLTQLTRDHTLAQQCIDEGFPVLAQSWHHTLTNWLGGNREEMHVDFHHFRLSDGDRLLLCTDGLTEMVNDEEVAVLLSQHESPPDAARALIDTALEHGGRDNVTVIVAQYKMKESAEQL